MLIAAALVKTNPSPAWKMYLGYRNRFIERNIGLVLKFVSKYSNSIIPKEDLFQEGVIGLSQAVGKFDIDLGFKFSTYATWWIKACVFRYFREQSRTVRLPINVQEKIERFGRELEKLNQTGEDLDSEAVAERAGMKPSSFDRIRNIGYRQALSIDTPSNQHAEASLRTVLEDPRDMIGSLESEYDMAHVREILFSLPERQRLIMTERFGFDGGDGRTLQEIANDRQLSRERVRQIQDVALIELRSLLADRLKGSEILISSKPVPKSELEFVM
jgi:RNA polymerase nonessential primary-like sigma factor